MVRASIILIATLPFIVGCSYTSPIMKASESKSEFSDDPAKTVKPLKGNPDIYRAYDRGATGFVPIGAVREGLEDRCRKFCEDKGKALEMLASDQVTWPHFPAVELIFTCIDKPGTNHSDRIDKLNDLKRLLDTGALTQAEFDTEKRRLLDGR